MSCSVNSQTDYVNFGINAYLHIFILFLFLSVFFMIYVTKLIKSAFDNEMSGLISSSMKQRIDTLSDEQYANLLKVRDILPIDGLVRVYSGESPAVTLNNQWLFEMIITLNVIMFIILVLSIYLRKSADQCLPFGEILLKNIIIFAFVGVVEYMFFTHIAFQYIPVNPSVMIDSFISSIKKNI